MPCLSISMSWNITNPHTDNTVSLSMSLWYYCLSWLRSVPIGQFHDDSWDLLPQNCTVACWEKAYPVPTREERGLRVSTREWGTYEGSSFCLLLWYHNLYVLVLLTLIYWVSFPPSTLLYSIAMLDFCVAVSSMRSLLPLCNYMSFFFFFGESHY